ncbi:M28 family peptidase [Adlercreutzia sp. R25]|uniref:M28 family peptidase n=1 Tax=Adlercreutzia shanghongiae TaxID=3111773 RepID=UPI002DBDB9D4|nr:M28 family peptidase [Adlercreutzia sp. R25]MEC4272047.1 M28 family peptidase [Adlercreutzia sp. R25]
MAEVNEHVAYLSQEIGPRPAGTEEEQRAALYISEQLSATAGLTASMEDFQCNPDSSLPRALCSGVAVLVILLATIVSVLAIPATVIAVLCAALVAAEVFDKPVLSRLLNRGVSQNVVAKYIPAKSPSRASRRRKVIVVANYDSGKVRRGLKAPVLAALPVIYWAELVALVLMPALMIIRTVASPEGTGLIAFNGLLAVGMVLAVLPAVSFGLEKLANYNEGANCNAAGVAVLLEVAARVAASRDLPDEPAPTIHGEQAAQSAGLVPEGAEISYNVGNTADDLGTSMESAAERLAAAKAAVAALSGKPVSQAPATDEVLVSESEGEVPVVVAASAAASSADDAAEVMPVSAPMSVAPVAVSGEPNVPDWFKKGQEQAKKPRSEKPAQRSRYATALEKVEEEINAREESERSTADELSERMRGMRDSVRAASAAAGATPTGVIADLTPVAAEEDEKVIEVPAVVEVPEVAPEVVPATSSSLPTIDAAEAPAIEVPSPADDISAPRGLDAVPEVAPVSLPTEDPDVLVRDGQRPLTGATVAAAPINLSDLQAVPSPAAPAEGPACRLVVPSVGEVVAAPAPASAPADVAPAPAHRRRRAISLPDIGISQELPRISMEDRQQAAPLSEQRPAHDGRVHDLSAVIPAVAEIAEAAPAATSSREASLFDALPSLGGGAFPSDPGLSGSINLAGTFSAMGATGAAAPIGEELIENATEEDLYIEDVDDSAYAEQVTETGAMAGPGYVEMPKSRFGGLFGKLRRKNRDDQSTPQEWLEVEEGFDAREAGAARGGWESFRNDDEFDDSEDYAPADATMTFAPEFDDDFADEEFPAPRSLNRRGRPFEGGAFSRDMLDDEVEEEIPAEDEAPREAASVFAEGLPSDFVFEADPAIEQIEQLRSERIDMEVWFVALGSELAGNGGTKAFMEAHEADMKGSIVIELEGLGDGELTLINKEGTYLSKKASSRMKRLARKAGQAVGLKVPEGTMEWRDSASAYVLKHGQQAMHLAGMANGKPAFFAEEDDVIENIDNDMLALNTDFVMELLKNI